MRYIFLMKGKARDVFNELKRQAILEQKIGRLIEPLAPVDFNKN